MPSTLITPSLALAALSLIALVLDIEASGPASVASSADELEPMMVLLQAKVALDGAEPELAGSSRSRSRPHPAALADLQTEEAAAAAAHRQQPSAARAGHSSARRHARGAPQEHQPLSRRWSMAGPALHAHQHAASTRGVEGEGALPQQTDVAAPASGAAGAEGLQRSLLPASLQVFLRPLLAQLGAAGGGNRTARREDGFLWIFWVVLLPLLGLVLCVVCARATLVYLRSDDGHNVGSAAASRLVGATGPRDNGPKDHALRMHALHKNVNTHFDRTNRSLCC
eukprot:TRINITY_DN60634_c0_g1_i1.p1 TRINITY_DN60634_c0_g1~~TRINITY_DN60634_c0_g1_i1.p1  ORF type:complete len:283 (-),score=49.94 TRINITY_DN60634_c0_g1_i1:30-878(-)